MFATTIFLLKMDKTPLKYLYITYEIEKGLCSRSLFISVKFYTIYMNSITLLASKQGLIDTFLIRSFSVGYSTQMLFSLKRKPA